MLNELDRNKAFWRCFVHLTAMVTRFNPLSAAGALLSETYTLFSTGVVAASKTTDVTVLGYMVARDLYASLFKTDKGGAALGSYADKVLKLGALSTFAPSLFALVILQTIGLQIGKMLWERVLE